MLRGSFSYTLYMARILSAQTISRRNRKFGEISNQVSEYT